jgi:hypothetical protein
MFTNISITALVLLPFFTPALSICPRLEEYRRLWTLGEVQAYNQDQTCSICLFITNETIVYAFSKPIQPPPVIVTLFASEVLITIAGDTFGQSLCPMHGVLATVSTLPIRLLWRIFIMGPSGLWLRHFFPYKRNAFAMHSLFWLCSKAFGNTRRIPGNWLAAIIGFKLCWWLQKTYSKPWARRVAIWSFLLSEGILILYQHDCLVLVWLQLLCNPKWLVQFQKKETWARVLFAIESTKCV